MKMVRLLIPALVGLGTLYGNETEGRYAQRLIARDMQRVVDEEAALCTALWHDIMQAKRTPNFQDLAQRDLKALEDQVRQELELIQRMRETLRN